VKRRKWPLRRRLLAATLGLCAAGLATFTTSSVLLLDQSLTARADRQLRDMATSLQDRRVPPPPTRGDEELPTDFSLHVYTASGELKWKAPQDNADGPAITTALVLGSPSGPVTVPDRQQDVDWRVMTVRGKDSDRVVIALSLAEQENTVTQLLLIEVAAGLLIVVLVAAVGRAVVRLGLLPLTRMERTATERAAGNVELRVTDSDPHTETGQLGRALNTMLTQLEVALRDRESSQERLRRFVADASHELRTPLTTIRGFAELYRHGEASRDPAVERVLRRIEDEAARMGVMVDDLLLLARLDREPALDLSEVDVCALVEDVAHDALARHPERSVAADMPRHRPRVLADGHRLHQVVANLVGNALVHSPPGADVRVRVRYLIDTVAIEVHDDGPGVPAEHLPFLFDRFYRADPARPTGGTGLGLAISAALVEAHDGRLTVTSEPGHGTTFHVVVPVAGPANT
jgi:two-component system OmpR family sensor kinase